MVNDRWFIVDDHTSPSSLLVIPDPDRGSSRIALGLSRGAARSFCHCRRVESEVSSAQTDQEGGNQGRAYGRVMF